MPVAAVLAGFYYNKDIFKELGLKVPTTQAEFIAVLQKIKDNGKYAPLALRFGRVAGSSPITASTSIGPAYWKGEEGRLGLIDGTKKLTDPEFVAAFKAFADWKPFLPAGYESLAYADMTQLFTLGKAAILPDGSWDINQVTTTGLNVGVFGPPVAKAGDQRYLQEMPDMGIGINAKSANQDAAKTFLTGSPDAEFQQLYVNKAPGLLRHEQPEPVELRQQAGAGLRRSQDRRQADAAPRPRPPERRHAAARRRDLARAAGDVHHGDETPGGRDCRTAEGPRLLVQAAERSSIRERAPGTPATGARPLRLDRRQRLRQEVLTMIRPARPLRDLLLFVLPALAIYRGLCRAAAARPRSS